MFAVAANLIKAKPRGKQMSPPRAQRQSRKNDAPMQPKRGGWNKGVAVGSMRPLDEEQIRAIRRILKQKMLLRDLALFETALSTMLRGGDVLHLKVSDVRDSVGTMRQNFTVRAKKTGRPVSVGMSDTAKSAVRDLIKSLGLGQADYLFTAAGDPHGEPLTTVSYRRFIKQWCNWIHVDPAAFSTHSLRRTRAAIIYRETGNLRAVQLLLGHASIDMTQRYLGVEEKQALELAKRYEV